MEKSEGKSLRVLVWDCEKGCLAQDFMTDSFICGYDAEKDGRKIFKTFFANKNGKRAKIADLKYMRLSCKRLIKYIRREKESE